MREKKEAERESGHPEVLLKNIQYLMLAVLLGAAFFLPAHGAVTQRKGSGEVPVQNTIQREAPEEKEGGAGAKEEKTAAKGTIVLDAGHGGEQERSFFICFLIIAEICLVFYQSWQFTCL